MVGTGASPAARAWASHIVAVVARANEGRFRCGERGWEGPARTGFHPCAAATSIISPGHRAGLAEHWHEQGRVAVTSRERALSPRRK